MRILKGWIIVVCLGLAACGGENPAPPKPMQALCGELDTLFQTLHTLDSVLMNDEPWPTCVPYLDLSLRDLGRNQRPGNEECNYLDQRYKPDELRLMFVETLRSRIEEDTIPEGIYYLLRLMGIFKSDPEISAFFSEELSYVAMANPECYMGYLQKNPDQEVMLLYSTKWNSLDLDSLHARFSRIPNSEAVVNFLGNLKEQKSDGI